jgi:Ni/Co efflux regulator RcnB
MSKIGIVTLLVSGALVALPSFAYTQQARQDERQDERQSENNQRHEYHFKPENKTMLRKNYPNRSKVDWNHRDHFVAGQRLTGDWHARIEPVPESVIRELPPIPAGLAIGYIDGYCVVYNPNDGMIVEVLDLH